MVMFAVVASSDLLTVGAIVLGAIAVFWILHKIVKFVLSLVVVLLIAAAAIAYCVKAGYISRENAEKINPLNSEQIMQAAKDAGDWAGTRAKDVAKKAIDAAVKETVDRAIPPKNPSR